MLDLPQEIVDFDPNSPDWALYFRTRRIRINRENAESKARKKHLVIRDILDDAGKVIGTEEILREAPYEVLTRGHLFPDLTALPQTPRGIARRAQERQWGVRASRALVHVRPVLYASSSKQGQISKRTGEAVEYEAGDVRYEGFHTYEWGLYGGLATEEGDPVASFRAFYTTRITDHETLGKTAFDHAFSIDQMPGQEVFQDYYPTATEFAAWFDALVPKPAKKEKS